MQANKIEIIDADSEKLLRISMEGQLALNLEEMQAIKKYFFELGRNPTDVELETFAQTWSEHCIHKTFRGLIKTPSGEVDNLLKSTVARVTHELSPEWCFSVFEDNAGIVDFEGDYAIAFKVETHNHPSSIEPFGGAATGVGGVIRDILGVWGEPIANTDVLCFGNLDINYSELPTGFKHPRFIFNYVVAGIGYYGNNMGIPTVNGAIIFDNSYITNPLVYCGTVGIVNKSKYRREAKVEDILILAGGKTGRDGIHGVTFASTELGDKAEEIFSVAVQIGDPIEEEKIKRALLEIKDKKLGNAITDIGGGGLSSAIGEMADTFNCGAMVYLEKVPLKYPNMKPWEIWVSESQERMLVIVPEKNKESVLEIFDSEEVEAMEIGRLTGDGLLKVFHEREKVAEISIEFLFHSIPRVVRSAEFKENVLKEPEFEMGNLGEDLKSILAMPNIASKESVIRTYDHEVRASTVIKPLQGENHDGPGDASVLKPLRNSWQGIVISNGINPEYGKISPYWMAASAIDEAIRNNIAVGGRRIALLDNFCWGNPEKPENLGSLVKAAQACYDIAKVYRTPFISGKDSLYNESSSGAVTPTLLISAMGIIPDIRRAVTMGFKGSGNYIYLAGDTGKELGGSHYYKLNDCLGISVPKVEPEKAIKTFKAVTEATDRGLVSSCHDLSEGGLGVALAEMCFAGGYGAKVELSCVDGELREDFILFSESNSRFLIEVSPSRAGEFEELFSDVFCSKIGKTLEKKEIVVFSRDKNILAEGLDGLKKAWQTGVRL